MLHQIPFMPHPYFSSSGYPRFSLDAALLHWDTSNHSMAIQSSPLHKVYPSYATSRCNPRFHLRNKTSFGDPNTPSSYLGRGLLQLNNVAVQLDTMQLSHTDYEYRCSYQLVCSTNYLASSIVWLIKLQERRVQE